MEIRTSIFKGKEFKFICDPDSNPSYWCFEDEAAIRDQYWDIQPNDIVFDVGCAYGSYSLPALALGAAHVFAWNPLTSETDLLIESAKLNGFFDRLTIFNGAVYGQTGYLNPDSQLFLPESHAGSFAVRKLDDYLPAISAMIKPTSGAYLKMDIEGAEESVLPSAIQLLDLYNPKVMIENHEFKAAGIGNRVRSFMEGIGYRHINTVPYHSVTHSLYIR